MTFEEIDMFKEGVKYNLFETGKFIRVIEYVRLNVNRNTENPTEVHEFKYINEKGHEIREGFDLPKYKIKERK